MQKLSQEIDTDSTVPSKNILEQESASAVPPATSIEQKTAVLTEGTLTQHLDISFPVRRLVLT